MPTHRSLRAIQPVAVIAFVLCCAGVTKAEPTANRAPPAAVEQAKNAYEHGVAAYKVGRYRDAIELFSSADRLAPRPALAFNIARAYDKLNEAGPALAFYREYLRRGAEAGSSASVERRVRELSTVLAARGVQQLTVVSTPSGAALSIDGRKFGTTPATLELPPGQHRVTLSTSGGGEVSRTIELGVSDALLVEIELGASAGNPDALTAPSAKEGAAPDAIPASSSQPSGSAAPEHATKPLWPAWVVLGAGGAALAGAAVFEVMRSNAVDDARPPETSQVLHDERLTDAETYQTNARVLLGVGGALAVGGTVLWYALTRKPKATTSAALGCSPTGCVGGLRVVY